MSGLLPGEGGEVGGVRRIMVVAAKKMDLLVGGLIHKVFGDQTESSSKRNVQIWALHDRVHRGEVPGSSGIGFGDGRRGRSSRRYAITKQYSSEALAAAHLVAQGLSEAGVMSKQTMRKFEEMCLTPEVNPRVATARAREPGGVRALSKCDDGSGEPVGAGRETSAGRLAEAADAGGEEWPRGGGLTAVGRLSAGMDVLSVSDMLADPKGISPSRVDQRGCATAGDNWPL